ncbi:zinc dependent phospholipase C family protein [uncultured Paenibacillus sp.]|uniref:zinc dependent phospholipase C family protein n=1 Tax=uncultured Paenibacillus sp. TaxID=227322 RepID=UPI0015B093B2|nr:zinc dependent phospholipase C family protein [uncultured Paenibacillus sp.]
MPALWMHLEYGQRLAAEFRDRLPFLSELSANRNLYHVGCQGPDVLLFRGFWSWRGPSRTVRLGNLMHSRSCGPVLVDVFATSLMLPEPDRSAALLYFLGFLTHHLLDRNLHPYINWNAGYKGLDHQRFEIALDAVFLRRLKQMDVSHLPGWKEIDLSAGLPLPVRRILHDTSMLHYPEMSGLSLDSWQAAYHDMRLAFRLLFDPRGWKKSLAAGPLRGLFYPSVPSLSASGLPDYLNERHAEWRHSAVLSEIRTDSVWELWEQALEDGTNVLEVLAEWINEEIPEASARKREQFRQTLGDRSYDTGKECVSNLVNRYAEPIWNRRQTG